MKEHPQAAILRAIADGKTVEGKCSKTEGWFELDKPLRVIDDKNWQLRIKPETIVINGHEVPAPAREPLGYGQVYWQVSLGNDNMCCQYTWRGDYSGDMILLERGLIHLTKEAAITHAEALLSFTRSDT